MYWRHVKTRVCLGKVNNKLFSYWFKFKEFADHTLILAQMARFVCYKNENIVGKGEKKYGYQYFLPYPQCSFKHMYIFSYMLIEKQVLGTPVFAPNLWPIKIPKLTPASWNSRDRQIFWVNSLLNYKILTSPVESICRQHNKCESRIEICFGKSRKHGGRRKKCW